MADSKEGVVDELLLGDGFSIVDSTKGDGSAEQKDDDEKKEPEVKAVANEEKKEEKPTSEEAKPEDVKLNGHDTKSDALLITTEEDLEIEKKTEETAKEEEKKVVLKNNSNKEKRKQGDVWVSNITRHVKATDLKKHFSKHGKVLTAKIVTNGKSFFGYILMEDSDVANKCVRNLHNSLLDGKKITVSRQRPDQRRVVAAKPTVKPKEKKVEKKEEQVEKEKSAEAKKDDVLASMKRNEDKLRRDLDYHKREVLRLKRYLNDEQRRLRLEQSKNRNLSRDLQEVEAKLREERRKLDRERELYEKNQRNDRLKLESDRVAVKKELDEVKKLREYLKRKIEEESRRPRPASPYAYSAKRFRESSGEKPKYVEERTRTPPSPPKLSSRSKRSPDFAVEKERRPHHYISDRDEVGRHGGGGSLVAPVKPAAPAPPRNIWSSFHQEVWRVPPGAASTPFPSTAPSYSSQRPAEYNSKTSYGGQRDFKREHYVSSSVRKY